jgi:tRNA1(Val) A37 N6-methylase TrmN6
MERLDDILGYDKLKIFQNSDFFSFSLDSIILANYSTIRLRDKKIVDFCTGNGVIPLILSKRTSTNIVGVELQKDLCDLASKSVDYNGLSSRISIINSDIKDFAQDNLNGYDLVLCNPPYFKVEENSIFNISYEKMIARHEIMINLSDLCCCAKKVLKENGTFCIVHRSDRLMDILSEFRRNNIEPKIIQFVYENVNKESYLVLVHGQKAGKVGLKISKPIILYNLDGSMTDEYLNLQREVLM